MELVISKAFVEKFYDCYKAGNVYWEDFEYFLKKQLSPNTILVTDIPENDWFMFGMEYKWFGDLQEKTKKTEWVENLSDKISEISFYENLSPFLLFCIDKENNDCHKLCKKFGYSYINLTNLDKFWEVFYSEKSHQYHLKVTKEANIPESRRFDSWTKLKEFQHPISHIVIFDKYILSDKSKQKLNKNLFPLLKSLLGSLSPQKTLLFLTFIIEDKTDLMKKQTDISIFLKDEYPSISFDISIFQYAADVYVANLDGLHDRGIYTNYFRLRSGDSFNYFDDRGNVNNSTELHFDFVFGKNNEFIMKDLKDLKVYISKAIENPNRFIGNQNNPLLK